MYKIDWDKYLSYKRLRKEKELVETDFDSRECFESDLKRVIFCPALRRMHDKTQVIPLSNGDTLLTRLTHSIQVMDVAEMLATRLTRNDKFVENYKEKASIYADSITTILRTASLIHDIGNPPFGHFGEVSIQNYFTRYLNSRHIITDEESLDFTEFDGNALGLRIVSKLQYTGTLDGLNLTFATLGAYLKYPNKGASKPDGYVGCHKHGIFKSEYALFDKIVEYCNLNTDKGWVKRHPLSFLVEAADSICYGIMDVEDGYNSNWYEFDTIVDFMNEYIEKQVENKDDLADYMITKKTDNGTKKVFSIEKLIGFSRTWDPGDKNIPKDRRRLIFDFREKLMEYMVNLTVDKFVDKLEDIDKGEKVDELLRLDKFKVSKALGAFTYRYIITKRDVQQTELTGNSVISGLLDILLKYTFHEEKKYRAKINAVIARSRLEELIHENKYQELQYNIFKEKNELWDYDIENLTPYAKLRVIVDFVASMTDKYSVQLYQKLSGMML